MKRITLTVEKTNTGFSAGAEKYPVYTAGYTLVEIKKNMLEALNLHFEGTGKVVVEEEIKLSITL